MKTKRTAAALCSVVLVLCLALLPMTAFAGVTLANGKLEQLPGNPQATSPVYSKAWLDNVIIRDGSTAITAVKPTPKPDYPFSKTYKEFVDEVDHYAALHDINEATLAEAYDEIVQVFYYMVTALGMTDKVPEMTAYLQDYGIAVPTKPTAQDTARIGIVYAAAKYNAVYAVYDKEVTLPRGTTLEGAVVALISTVMDVFLPSGVNTINGLVVQAAKQNVEEFPQIPLSANPTNAEVFYWSKVITAAANDYEVPMTSYPETTAAQREYVDYAYYASIFNVIYDIRINPAKLAVAAQSPDKLAVQKLFLKTMLDEKQVSYASDATCEQLFEQACDVGCFELEQEFYSDVFDYDVLVDPTCTQLWFTPFGLASELGGDNQYLSFSLNGKELKPAATTCVDLDPNYVGQNVQLVARYDDGFHGVEQAVYNFYVVRSEEVINTNLADDFQAMLDRVAPQDSEQIQQIIDEAVGFAGDVVEADIFHPLITPGVVAGQDVLTTFGNANNGQAVTDENGNVDFNYLGQLIDETYPDNETAVTADLLAPSVSEKAPSLIARTGQAIKDHPQLVVMPTGILALGGLLGYFWNRKRKDPTSPLDEEETI